MSFTLYMNMPAGGRLFTATKRDASPNNPVSLICKLLTSKTPTSSPVICNHRLMYYQDLRSADFLFQNTLVKPLLHLVILYHPHNQLQNCIGILQEGLQILLSPDFDEYSLVFVRNNRSGRFVVHHCLPAKTENF